MPPRARRRIAALTILVIAAAACSGAGDAVDAPGVSPSDDRSTGTANESPSQGGIGVSGVPTATGSGPTAEVLRFSAPRLDGGTIEGEDYSGSDVAFWFWAPW